MSALLVWNICTMLPKVSTKQCWPAYAPTLFANFNNPDKHIQWQNYPNINILNNIAPKNSLISLQLVKTTLEEMNIPTKGWNHSNIFLKVGIAAFGSYMFSILISTTVIATAIRYFRDIQSLSQLKCQPPNSHSI